MVEHVTNAEIADTFERRAQASGVMLVISSDAHSTADLDKIRYGVDQARRSWVEARNVLNTLPLSKLLKRLRKT